jgi:hypothetical protein
MGVVVADGAVDLAEQRYPAMPRGRAQAIDDVGHFLAERRRRRRLAVRARHHRQFGQFVRQIRKAGENRSSDRQHRFVARRLQHQRVRKVVDVLGGAREMDELGDAHDFRIVARRCLIQYSSAFTSWLVTASIAFTSPPAVGRSRPPGIKLGQRWRRKGRDLDEMRLGSQRLEPLDLDLQAAPDQPVFGKLGAQRVKPGGVAAVQRGKGNKAESGMATSSRRVQGSRYFTCL